MKDEIKNLIDRSLHVDGITVQAGDVIDVVSKETLVKTLSLLVMYLGEHK